MYHLFRGVVEREMVCSTSVQAVVFVDPEADEIRVNWHVHCTAADVHRCRGIKQAAVQATIQRVDPVDGLQSTPVLTATVEPGNSRPVVTFKQRLSFEAPGPERRLAHDTEYEIRVTAAHTVSSGVVAPAAVAVARFRTALRQQDWNGASWIGGYTQLRTTFVLPAGTIKHATAYASGIGCFELTVRMIFSIRRLALDTIHRAAVFLFSIPRRLCYAVLGCSRHTGVNQYNPEYIFSPLNPVLL